MVICKEKQKNSKDKYALVCHFGPSTKMIDAVRTSEKSVCYNETTRRNIPEGCLVYAYHRQNLKPHISVLWFYFLLFL
jgi:hypothetical protein